MANNEEKELLLKDLCARLPYGVIVCLETGLQEKLDMYSSVGVYIESCRCKPYLRPMSSMTDDEFNELEKYSELMYDQLDLTSFQGGTYKCLDFYLNEVPSDVVIRVFDWLNKNHFDYRGLIERGLALEAPAGMYN